MTATTAGERPSSSPSYPKKAGGDRRDFAQKRPRDHHSGEGRSSNPPKKKKKDNNARNVKKKMKKRAKKAKSAAAQKAGKKGEDDEEETGEDVQTLLLDGHRVEEQDSNDDDDDVDENKVAAGSSSSSKKKSRNFTSDLKLYLELWQQHVAIQKGEATDAQYTLWKFNKVLQAWALDNCLDKEKVPLDVFKTLLLYIATVKGGARERLREQMIDIINKADERKAKHEELDEDEQAELKRAKKVLITIGKSDEESQN